MRLVLVCYGCSDHAGLMYKSMPVLGVSTHSLPQGGSREVQQAEQSLMSQKREYVS